MARGSKPKRSKSKGDGKLEEKKNERDHTAERVRDQANRAQILRDEVVNATAVRSAGAFAASGLDNSFHFSRFEEGLDITVHHLDEEQIVFDIIGIDASLANAFRRILIAEVPTVAIESVFIADNTSIVQDEVLSHRLGLIPLQIDPRKLEFKGDEDAANETNTVVFRLRVACTRNADGTLENEKVYSSSLEYLSKGSELIRESEENGEGEVRSYTSFGADQADTLLEHVGPVNDDILIAKLAPGQRIDLEAHCIKGIGKDHAKFSPVATAFYRLMPEIIVSDEVQGDLATEFVEKCPRGKDIFDIEEKGGTKRVVVARPRNCTLDRNILHDTGFGDYVKLNVIKDHFIFTIESTGVLPPETLFEEATKILEEKCNRNLGIVPGSGS